MKKVLIGLGIFVISVFLVILIRDVIILKSDECCSCCEEGTECMTVCCKCNNTIILPDDRM